MAECKTGSYFIQKMVRLIESSQEKYKDKMFVYFPLTHDECELIKERLKYY